MKTEPTSDFSLLNTAANLILEGKLSALKGIEYFNVWVYQLGFSIYCSCLYFLFGSNILVVKFLNVLFSTGTVVLIYFIALKIFNDKAARISSLLYAIYIQSIVFNSMLTNQVISAFFVYLGLLIITYKSGWGFYVLSGISMAIGHIMRPEGNFALYIIVIAIVFNSIFNFIKNKELTNKNGEKKPSDFISIISKAAVILLTFNIVVQLFGYSLKAFDITEYNFGNRNVYWKFVVGLNHSTNGGYSNEDAKILDKYPVGDELYRIEKDIIRERLENKYELAILAIKKFNIMWTHSDSTIQFISPGTDLTSNEIDYLVGLEKIQYALMLLFAGLTMFLIIKSKNGNLHLYIITLLISGYFAIYLLIEIQTRYRYFIVPAFFILSGFSLSKATDSIGKFARSLRQKNFSKG
ncbi:ArnT family glycosyltransferase [Acetivibrio cellulolyticus]|uniref:ArnT family glycosyltransferase n=1 Tax=Acetivibrio cellulolyticus TaxID=35830 RepID=UPI001F40BE12|nr:glycosyltransferase family 39 protein [Acetivibrio cellulolyticus]